MVAITLKHVELFEPLLFLNPPLAQVGLTEDQARAAGGPVAVKELPVAGMPRGHVNGDLRGAFKAVVNPETKEILGVTLFLVKNLMKLSI